jgi:Domain of unknown function (DUF5050)
MKYFDAEALPPCEYSAHCLRLLNDLDTPGDEHVFEQAHSTDTNDMQDEYLIEKLRVHVPDCPICSAKLASARLLRSRQRIALRRYLVDAESRVPSTTDRILSMARQPLPDEMKLPSASQKRQSYILPEVFVPLILPKNNGHSNSNGNGHFTYATTEQPSVNHSSHWLRNGFALATAAALLFAALGVFNHFVQHVSTPTSHEEGKSWTSMIIGVSLLSSLPVMTRLYNVDTTSGEREQLAPAIQSSQEIQHETVSPDGKSMLYYFSIQGQTVYTTLQMGQSGGVVTRVPDDDASNAIWMDNDHVLITHVHSGVEIIDIHTGVSVQHSASLINSYLLFYHSPYVYFQDAQQTVMYRSNLLTGDRKQLTSGAGGRYFTNCMLNPDGLLLYCEAQNNQLSHFGRDLYMVNGDGSGVQSLNRRGTLLGFTQDHTLLFLEAAANSYQVMQLGQTPQQDKIVMKNAAPPSAIVGAGNAMLAPDGHGLVVQDGNLAGASRGVWYDDLTTQTSRELFTYLPGSHGQLIGWDQLQVNGTTPTADTILSTIRVATAA